MKLESGKVAVVTGVQEDALTRAADRRRAPNRTARASPADPWFGPLSAWTWVLGVNLWGVIYRTRTFLPILLGQGSGHIVNTASVNGLIPGSGPMYDARKHAVVALTEDLFMLARTCGPPIGVSVLRPGRVRTGIADASRNWPARLGDAPPAVLGSEVVTPLIKKALEEGTPIADGEDPELEVDVPGIPPSAEIIGKVKALLAMPAG